MTDKNEPSALITGICGQDGAYLAELLCRKGYAVFGTSRDAARASIAGLNRLQVRAKLTISNLDLLDFSSVESLLRKGTFDEIYHLAGQSSVAKSFSCPREASMDASIASLNLLEAGRLCTPNTKFFFAGSGEIFGESHGPPVSELTARTPVSPYGLGKLAAWNQVEFYRRTYGLHCSCGILFNHESELRPEQFVVGKIIAAVNRIALGSKETLELGDISIQRDWGWAPEYVEAMWLMLQQEHPDDYILATGKTYTLQALVDAFFSHKGLNWRDHVLTNRALQRKSEVPRMEANTEKARSLLGWQPTVSGPDLALYLL